MPPASSLPAFRNRTRRSWPLGLAVAALVLAAAAIDPTTHLFAGAGRAIGLAPWLLLAGLGGLAARWRQGHRQDRLDERIRGRTAERERIARELHDHLLQGVIGLVLRVDESMQSLPPGHAARRQIESALDHAEEMLRHTREQVLQLQCPAPRTDLVAALEDAIRQRHPGARAGAGTGTAVDVVVTGRPRPLDPAAWAELHGIGLEAVTNALRHARAGRVVLALDYRRHAVTLRVRDDGVGLARGLLERGERPGHGGLRSMRERALMLGGHLELHAPAGGGTIVAVRATARVAYR